jgi:tetratricopeptide (TPR) repeat protein
MGRPLGNVGNEGDVGDVTVMTTQQNHVDALNLLGVIAAQARDFQRACQCFGQAAEVHAHAPTLCNWGLALQELRRFEAALDAFDRAIAVQADCAEAHFGRANALKQVGRWQEALGSYERAISIKPDYAEAHCNLGVAQNDLKLMEAALASFERALAIDPENATAHCNKAFTLLLLGDFRRGWRLYEWRWKLAVNAGENADRLAKPLWLGEESLSGKTILLRSEQGLGDTLQFCRYAKPVSDRGARVILQAQPPLVNLLADLDGISQLVAQGSPPPESDYYCPLMSLPLAFGTSLDTIPCAHGYLNSDAAKRADWRARLGAHTSTRNGLHRVGLPRVGLPRIGLAWSGNATNSNDRNRSIPLADFVRHLPEHFHYVSLQKEIRDADGREMLESRGILNPADELFDFSDTAALCDCMDLVISVDTSVAHLSGALGKTTWVLLPFSPSWRWLLGREDSPWYSRVTLFRQDAPGDWHGVMQRVAARLRQYFPNSAPALHG